MARIAGVDLPRDKRIEIGLTYIYGIGLATSKKILAEAGVDPDIRVKDLTEDEEQKLRAEIRDLEKRLRQKDDYIARAIKSLKQEEENRKKGAD